MSATVELHYILNPIDLQLCTFTRLPVLIQLKDSLQIYLSYNSFRAGIHSLRPNHEMQSQVKAVKAEKSYLKRAARSNLELPAIFIQKRDPKNRIISKAVNISHNQPIREGYLESGTRHLNS